MRLIKTTGRTIIHAIMIIAAVYVIYHIIYKQVECYYTSDPVLNKLKDTLCVLDHRLKDIQLYPASKSYTINKKNIYICMKDKDGQYYNTNCLAASSFSSAKQFN